MSVLGVKGKGSWHGLTAVHGVRTNVQAVSMIEAKKVPKKEQKSS
jgi:hypothetical protein